MRTVASIMCLFLSSGPVTAAEVFVGAGDIAMCDGLNDEKTAALLDNISGTVFTLGDNVYEKGTASEFRNCYGPSWGRHKARTRPTSGNHDYLTDGAMPYRNYFGVGKNYSFDLGSWHVVSLDSNCDIGSNGGCGRDQPVMQWLKADLAAHARKCTLVYFHHARWSSNLPGGGSVKMQAAWNIMFNAGVDVVLGAHSHSYERFAPLDANGDVSWPRGIRSFVVGTGGGKLKSFTSIRKGSQVRSGSTYGVLKLVLGAADYTWQFIPVKGATFTDSGFGTCHD